MKLNIGCGKEYKEGYINIDAFDSTVADMLMPANDLKFSSNSIEIIEAHQLIEHLGYINTIYTLAEWFRVLKPKGTLLIETPDLEKSFKEFINGDYETKKNVLAWIYGLETPGMAHKFCFPEDLLISLLKKSGFSGIEKTFIEIEKNHPTLRISCKKTEQYRSFQVISDHRKKLIAEKIVNLNDYILAVEQEELIDFFMKKLNQFVKNRDYKFIDDLVCEGVIHSEKMTRFFLQECISQNLLLDHEVRKHIKVLDFLIRINFSMILIHLLKESSNVAGSQKKIFQTICSIGKQSVKKLLSDKEKSNVKVSLSELSKEHDLSSTFFFSEDLLQREAARLSYLGTKEFILNHYDKALSYFNDAIKLERNNILYYWNLGRLQSLTKDFTGAKGNYQNAIKLVNLSDYKEKMKLEQSLKKELKNISSKQYRKPITKL